MKKYVNGKIIGMTPAEIAAMQDEQARAAAVERKRPLTESEVTAMLLRQQINTIAVDDQTALRMQEYYPEWTAAQAYAAGERVQYRGKLYRVAAAHTSQADWTPDAALTLFVRIDEEHDGSKYDPVPYEGNMVLVQGMYYSQDGAVYLCIRDTGNPVYHPLSELVGTYVEEVPA